MDRSCTFDRNVGIVVQSPASTSKTPEWGVPPAGAEKEDSSAGKEPKAGPKGWRGVGESQVRKVSLHGFHLYAEVFSHVTSHSSSERPGAFNIVMHLLTSINVQCYCRKIGASSILEKGPLDCLLWIL